MAAIALGLAAVAGTGVGALANSTTAWDDASHLEATTVICPTTTAWGNDCGTYRPR